MAVREQQIVLDAEGIDNASEMAAEFLEAAEVDRRGLLSARIAFESSLIMLSEHFGADTPASLSMGKWLGHPRLSVKVRGERFDPRKEDSQSEWESLLMETAGLRPTYAYRGGYNVVAISCPRRPLGSMFISAAAIVLGVLLSLAGQGLPVETRALLLDEVIEPLFDMFVGILSGVAGPMVFCSVAWGICGIGDMAALGRSGRAVISRFMGANVAATLMALVICIPLLPMKAGSPAADEGQVASTVRLFIELLPTNMIAPFVRGNMLQIIVLSVAVGVAALALGDAAEGVRRALRELNRLTQFLMEQICRLVPAFIVVMMVQQAWTGTMPALLDCWMSILVICSVMVGFLALQFIVVSIRHKVSIAVLLRACLPSMVMGFTTASVSASFASMRDACGTQLGIDNEQSTFGIPLGMVLCKPATPIIFTIIMLYSAQAFEVGVDVVWYVRLGVTCLLYAIAVPPVPGGTLACYGAILGSLGIPSQALTLATALDLLLDNPTTSGNVGGLLLEMFAAADSLGAVDRSKLKTEETRA